MSSSLSHTHFWALWPKRKMRHILWLLIEMTTEQMVTAGGK